VVSETDSKALLTLSIFSYPVNIKASLFQVQKLHSTIHFKASKLHPLQSFRVATNPKLQSFTQSKLQSSKSLPNWEHRKNAQSLALKTNKPQLFQLPSAFKLKSTRFPRFLSSLFRQPETINFIFISNRARRHKT
jgi:hypothetical protein